MAANRLIPKNFEDEDEEFLEPAEVIRRLRAEFAVIEIDKDAAKEMIDHRIAYIEEQLAEGHDPSRQYHETLDRLRSGIDDAHLVYISDEPNSKAAFLTTVVMPNEPLFFGYQSAAQEKAAPKLLRRCAKALGYDIEK